MHGDALLYTVGRQANADLLEPAGGRARRPTTRGRIAVNEYFQTAVPHIYAAGDVIGFPALASTSMEQGRLASCHMFGSLLRRARPQICPTASTRSPRSRWSARPSSSSPPRRVPYEVGVAKFEELAKGQMLGDETGLLKLLFDPKTRKLLGVHVIGERATEIIHIGQAVLAFGGTIDYFRDTVFNYPTLAEAYKVAGLDGINRL